MGRSLYHGGMLPALPTEVNVKIMNYLGKEDAIKAGATSRYAQSIMNLPSMIQRLHDWDFIFRNALDEENVEFLYQNFYKIDQADKDFLIEYALRRQSPPLYIMIHEADDLAPLRSMISGDDNFLTYIDLVNDLRREALYGTLSIRNASDVEAIQRLTVLERKYLIRYCIRQGSKRAVEMLCIMSGLGWQRQPFVELLEYANFVQADRSIIRYLTGCRNAAREA